MKRTLTFFIVILTGLSCSGRETDPPGQTGRQGSDTESTEISFTTTDGLTVFGDLFVKDITHPSILLFHQGGSNARAEYAPIIPRLTDLGYNVLAVDQRTGGQLYGSYNRTISYLSPYRDFGYCETYPDLEGALDYMITHEFSGPLIAWGSSYSGTLAIQLAYKHPDKIDAVLGFSPAGGSPMDGCRSEPYFEQLITPLLVLRPDSELEMQSAKTQFELADSNGHQIFIAEGGTHGSSMLIPERVNGSTDPVWKTVLSFIEQSIQ